MGRVGELSSVRVVSGRVVFGATCPVSGQNDPLSFDRYRGPDPTFIISREINLQVLGNNTQTDDVFHM